MVRLVTRHPIIDTVPEFDNTHFDKMSKNEFPSNSGGKHRESRWQLAPVVPVLSRLNAQLTADTTSSRGGAALLLAIATKMKTVRQERVGGMGPAMTEAWKRRVAPNETKTRSLGGDASGWARWLHGTEAVET